MSLKEKFLTYVEMQRSARNYREVHGVDNPKTVDAYQRANQVKREVINMIDELEYRMESLEK